MGHSGSKGKAESKKDGSNRTVFMPVDTSQFSEKSVRWAAANFVKDTDRVKLTSYVADQTPFVGEDETPPVDESELWVADAKAHKVSMDRPITAGAFLGRMTATGMAASACKVAEAACDKYVSIMKNESGVNEDNITCDVKRYNPGPYMGVGPTLMKGAEEVGADTIVMGSRGLGAISRSLLRPIGLGSATDYIVHNAAVPVVVVKPNK